MVDSEYSLDKYKTLKISIGTIRKNPEILKSVPDHLSLQKCVNM